MVDMTAHTLSLVTHCYQIHAILIIEIMALSALVPLIPGVPGGVMREGEVHGWEVVVPDTAQEDSGCKLFGGDPGGQFWPEEVVERMASAEDTAEEGGGQVLADGEH